VGSDVNNGERPGNRRNTPSANGRLMFLIPQRSRNAAAPAVFNAVQTKSALPPSGTRLTASSGTPSPSTSPYPSSLQTCSRSRSRTEYRESSRRSDGSEVPVEISLSPLAADDGSSAAEAGLVTAFIRDVRERREAQARLRALESERHLVPLLRGLLVAASEAAVEVTQADVAAVAVHQAAAVGAAAGAVVLLSEDGEWIELLHERGYEGDVVETHRRYPLETTAPAADAIRTAAPVWLGSREAYGARYPHREAVAAAMPYAAHAAVPLVSRGRALGALGVSFAAPREFGDGDKTFLLALAQVCANNLARARLYEEAVAARATAEEARRQRDVFVAVAGHELRTPLASVRGYAQLARRQLRERAHDQRSGASLDPLERALEAIEAQTVHMARLVGDLLDAGRIQSGTLAVEVGWADLRSVVDAAVAAARQRAGADRFVVRGPEALPAWLDATRIEQVVANLLDNAVRHSAADEEIEVIVARPDAASVRLMVRDRGVGIPLEHLPHVFDPYYRAHDGGGRGGGGGGGMGLGLYICREIVARHRGRIEITCPEDGGTLVTVSLPADGDVAVTN
jgi:hypothetical protein